MVKAVLIETLWNVNMLGITWTTEKNSINRNIVECKSKPSFVPFTGQVRINRNIVECKFKMMNFAHITYPVLIETLWNVNNDFNVSISFCIHVLIETLWNVNVYKRY